MEINRKAAVMATESSQMTLNIEDEIQKGCPNCDALRAKLLKLEQDNKILQDINARHELITIFKTAEELNDDSDCADDSLQKPIPVQNVQSLVTENNKLKSKLGKLDYVRNIWDSYIDTLQTVTERLEITEIEIEVLKMKLQKQVK